MTALRFFFSFAALWAFFTAPGASATSISLPIRSHPFLYADAKMFEQARHRAERLAWAAKVRDRIVRAADILVGKKLQLPPEGGQWSHYGSCKECGASLKQRKDHHVCSKCKKEYKGWPYDQLVYTKQHKANWDAVQTLGLAYQLTLKEKYARQARKILLAYADAYTSYPLHDVWGGSSKRGARVFPQTLSEATSIIPLVWGYDLVYASPAFRAGDHRRIEEGLLRPAAQVIRRLDAGISNWQTWHNAAFVAIGLCLGDTELVDHALNGRSGVRFQLKESVLEDGFWYEGAASYHFYSLRAMRWAVEAAANAGLDFGDVATYRKMYEAPLAYTLPDDTLPAVNDSGSVSIDRYAELYEVAFGRFGLSGCLPVLRKAGRTSVEALLFGPDEIPETEHSTPAGSCSFPGLGAAVLRQGSGPQQACVHLDYGPHGGYHGHADKLAVIFSALGKVRAPDPGALAYSVPLHEEWYKQSIAHNTVTVDGRSQLPATGRLEFLGTTSGLTLAQAACDEATTGVVLRRTLGLTPLYLIDVFDVSSSQAHTWDWAWHNTGKLKPEFETTRSAAGPGSGDGYQHIKQVVEATLDQTWSAGFLSRDGSVRLTMMGSPATKVFCGVGMTGRPPEPCPLVIARREGEKTRFISVVEPYRSQPQVLEVKQLSTEEPGALLLQIGREGGEDLFLLAPGGGKQRAVGPVETSARACLVHIRQGRAEAVHEFTW